MDTAPPTRRPTDLDATGSEDVRPPTALLNLPWIDPHNYAHTLSWDDRERYALSGCAAMVMVASGNHWIPYKPVRAEDVRYLWDDAINRRGVIERDHFFDARLAVGIQTGVRVEDPDELLDAMDDYLALDAVVAVGEVGIRPSQHVSAWPLAEQRAVLEGQMELASRRDLPVVLHTPSSSVAAPRGYRQGLGIPGYEKRSGLDAEPVIDSEDAALEAVRVDVEAARDAGLDERRVVASHADPEIAPYLAEETECYLSYTIGASWLTGVTPATVAEAISAYGPDRVMMDSDCANVLRSDPLSTKRAILELYRLGVDEDAIRQVVFENPRDVFEFGA